MGNRLPAEGTNPAVCQGRSVVQSMISCPLPGDLLDGLKDPHDLPCERFCFHPAALCNKQTGIYKNPAVVRPEWYLTNEPASPPLCCGGNEQGEEPR